MNASSTYHGFLDSSHTIPVHLCATASDDETTMIDIEVDISAHDNPTFRKNIATLLGFSCENHTYIFTPHDEATPNTLKLRARIPNAAATHHPLTLTLNNQPITEIQCDPHRVLSETSQTPILRLTSSECAMASRYMNAEMLKDYPANRAAYRDSYDPHAHAPITELHSHLSAELTPAELMELGLTQKLAYPCDLLELAGINTSNYTHTSTAPAIFNPALDAGIAVASERGGGENVPAITLNDLSESDQKRLQKQLAVPYDRIIASGQMDETFYRFRNPLAKNDDIGRESVRIVAQRAVAQGIRYMELSTGAMLKPSWLEAVLPMVEEARERGVEIRFLVGIPRSSKPHQVSHIIEKTRYLMKHPAIAGVDFLGYESTKTKDFTWAINSLCRAARNERPDDALQERFSIRIHAGETTKNTSNMGEAARISDITAKYAVGLRIGHAINGELNAAERELMRANNVICEFIPGSNIRLNNAITPRDVPISQAIAEQRMWVLGSDGRGCYHDDNEQLARTALYAGARVDDLTHMRENEERFIAEKQSDIRLLREHYHALFPQGDRDFIKGYEAHCQALENATLPLRFNGKKPILIAGASGGSWNRIDAAEREILTLTLTALVHFIAPHAAYFVTGRAQDEGVTACLDRAIETHNHKHHTRFDMVSLLCYSPAIPQVAKNVTFALPITGDADKVPKHIMRFMDVHLGYAHYIGGNSFTRDLIHLHQENTPERSADHRHFSIAATTEGSTQELAAIIAPAHHIIGESASDRTLSLLNHIGDSLGNSIFRDTHRPTRSMVDAVMSDLG